MVMEDRIEIAIRITLVTRHRRDAREFEFIHREIPRWIVDIHYLERVGIVFPWGLLTFFE